MNFLDEFYNVVLYIKQHIDEAVAASVVAFVVAYLRTTKEGLMIKPKLLESTLCGLFVWVTITSSIALGIPEGFNWIIAGGIGWYGTERISRYLWHKVTGEDYGSNREQL